MLLGTIIFDEKSKFWSNDLERNYRFISHVECLIRDLLNTRGYVYLNQIYELLGKKWDPDRYNLLILSDNEEQFRYVEFELFLRYDGACLINILASY